ncbi:MAG: PAS domain S-box protein [Acidobacteria bacterium]|nr:MAG: PAS domain S-box protein [Acidobacteriota bacterium]
MSLAPELAAQDMEALAEQAALLDLTSDAMVVRDLSGIVRYWNRGAERMYGWTRSEAAGKQLTVLLQSRYPQPLAEIEAAVLATGHWEGELQQVRQSGAEVVVSSRWVLRRDGSGQPAGMLESNTDITMHRRREVQLQENELRFRALMDSAPDGILVLNAAGQIIHANRNVAAILEAPVESLTGRSADDCIAAPLREQHRAHREAALQQTVFAPAEQGIELAATRPDGSELPVEVRFSHLRLGTRSLVIESLRDIRDRRQHEMEEHHRQQLELLRAGHLATLGEIAAGLAHEIKNPLAGIAAALEILQGEVCSEPEVMADVVQQVGRIRNIVDDLLHYARPRPPAMEVGDLNAAVERAVRLAAPMACQHHTRLMLAPGNLPPVRHDAEQIERLVTNLLINGVQATGSGGTGSVSVTTAAEGGMASISVRDNGRGIAPAELPNIFRPFFTTKGPQGNGLGLPLCQRIAELHGGRIDVRSQPQCGSTFTVWLPLTYGDKTPNPDR